MSARTSWSRDAGSGRSVGEPGGAAGGATDFDLEAQTNGRPGQEEQADGEPGAASAPQPPPEAAPSFTSGRSNGPTETPPNYVRRLIPDPLRESHYILVIHGTFDAPSIYHGAAPWYWPDPGNKSNFCNLLRRDLRHSPLGGKAVWRQPPASLEPLTSREETCYPFSWPGGNTHGEREAAGINLCKLINGIGKEDPSARVHLIAHSHGGNVVLKAVSKYLNILRKECDRSYNDAITAEFWAAHGAGHRDVARFQWTRGASPFHAWLGPLLIVQRPWKGDEALGDFSYGYWPSTDWLLGLGKRRQAVYLRRKWAASASTNALGHIVFMGTPFYTKYFDRFAALYMVVECALTSVVVFAVLVAVVVLVKFAVSGSASDTNVSTYQYTFWVVLACASISLVAFNQLRQKRFRDGNIYFNETRAWAPHMRALVLNAGKLDEAALALSAEPLVRAYLIPQLRHMLKPEPWKKWRHVAHARGVRGVVATVYHNSWLIFWNVIFFVPSMLLYCLNSVLVAAISNSLLKFFITLGFGLQKGELDHAKVFVEEYLRLDPKRYSLIHWNVQRILTAAANEQLESLAPEGARDAANAASAMEAALEPEEKEQEEKPITSADRWKFLWDNGELEVRAERCTTMRRLKKEMKKIPLNPKMPRDSFERELKLICVTLEERYKEMSGSVELSHGSYFRNRAVIAAVTHFVVHGVLPDWAVAIGDLISVPGIEPSPAVNPSVEAQA